MTAVVLRKARQVRKALAPTAPSGRVAAAGVQLLAAGLLSSLLGYAAWFVLARTAPQDVVGSTAAAAAALTWVAVFVTAGLAPTLTTTLPNADLALRSRLVGAAWTAVGAVAAAAGGVAVVVAVAFGVDPVVAVAAWALTTATAAGLLSDAVLVGLGRTGGVLVRVAATGVLRVAAATAVGVVVATTATVFAGWAAAAVAGAVVAAAVVARAGLPIRVVDPRPVFAGSVRRLGWNQLATVTGQLPAAALPLTVAVRADAAEAAQFYMAWLLASGCALVHAAVTPALLAEASRPGRAAAAVRHAARFTAALLFPAAAATLLLGLPVLGFLGGDYRAAYPLLVVLVVGAGFDAATALTAGVWRATGRERGAAVLNGAMAVVAVGGAWLVVPAFGAMGAVAAFVAAQVAGTATVVAVRVAAAGAGHGR